MDGPIQWMLKVCEILSTGAALALETADGWSPMKDLYGFLITVFAALTVPTRIMIIMTWFLDPTFETDLLPRRGNFQFQWIVWLQDSLRLRPS